jgi:hypothetical protein
MPDAKASNIVAGLILGKYIIREKIELCLENANRCSRNI